MRKNFTLIEIMMVVVIVGIIATFSIPGYHNLIERSRDKVCVLNQKVLLEAVINYGLENDILPASLGQLNNQDIKRALAKVLKEEKSWQYKFACFLVDFNKRGLVYAASWLDNYIDSLQSHSCPADSTPPPGGYSYGISSAIARLSYAQFRALPAGTIAIGDSDTAILSLPVSRHKIYQPFAGTINYPIQATVGSVIIGREAYLTP